MVETVPGDFDQVEWWQRVADGWHAWLGSHPRVGPVARIAGLVSVAVVVLACIAVPEFRKGMGAWVPCFLMLLGWLALSPTKTVRWTSVLRLFSVSTVWALVVARLSVALSDGLGLGASAAGPGIAIAAFGEETLKITPVLVLAVLAPGRLRRFAVADWLLVGLAAGMGFQVAEDFVRQAVSRPNLFSLLLDDPSNKYGVTLFGGEFDIPGVAAYAGHQITTALVVLAIGFALHGRRRRWRGGLLIWLLPVAAWLLVVSDHVAFNAANANAQLFASGRSEVNPVLYWVWKLTDHGYARGWLLIAGAAAAMLCDALGQRQPTPSATAAPATAAPPIPPATPATGGPPPPPGQGQPLPPSAGWVSRMSTSVGQAAQALAGQIADQFSAAAGVLRLPQAKTPLGLLRMLLAAMTAFRLQRGRAMAREVGPGSRARFRSAVALAGVVWTAAAVVLALVMARQIGRTLDGRSAWFAGLLDGLFDWWNGMGPGGQGLVVLGAAALLLGVGLILAPEIVIPGLIVTGEGILVGSEIVVPAAVTTVAGQAVVGGGLVVMATGATSGSGGGDGGDRGGGRGSSSEGEGEGGTQPSREPGDHAPGGRSTKIEANADADEVRSITRENESAQTLSRGGYDVEQNPAPKPNGTRPDYKIEGDYFDNYAPGQANARNIGSQIEDKIVRGQTDRVILNLDDSSVSVDAVRSQLTDWPISGLKEVIAIKDGAIIPLFP